MRDSVVLYTEYAAHIERLSMEQRGELFTAIFAYQTGSNMPKLDDVTGMAFDFISAQLKRDNLKYDETCRKCSEAGKLGGRPKKAIPVEKQTEANGYSENQTKTKKADNENEDDYDNVNENGDDFNKRMSAPPKRFHPPTLEEVEEYCAEKGYRIDAERFIAYYASIGWKVGGKAPMKDWRSAVVSWAHRDKGGGSPKKKSRSILNQMSELYSLYGEDDNGGSN